MSADPYSWRMLRQAVPRCTDSRGHSFKPCRYDDTMHGTRFGPLVMVSVFGETFECVRCGCAFRVQVVLTGTNDAERLAYYKRSALACAAGEA